MKMVLSVLYRLRWWGGGSHTCTKYSTDNNGQGIDTIFFKTKTRRVQETVTTRDKNFSK